MQKFHKIALSYKTTNELKPYNETVTFNFDGRPVNTGMQG